MKGFIGIKANDKQLKILTISVVEQEDINALSEVQIARQDLSLLLQQI